jgi:purine-cytosine permease-like protein
MKTRIAAFLTFFGALGWGAFGLVLARRAMFEELFPQWDKMLPISVLLLTAVVTALYVVWTRFGRQ